MLMIFNHQHKKLLETKSVKGDCSAELCSLGSLDILAVFITYTERLSRIEEIFHCD